MPIHGSKGALLGRLSPACSLGVDSTTQISAVRMDFDIAYGRKPAPASRAPIKKAHLFVAVGGGISKVITFASAVEP